jgi:hypothetical protein
MLLLPPLIVGSGDGVYLMSIGSDNTTMESIVVSWWIYPVIDYFGWLT